MLYIVKRELDPLSYDLPTDVSNTWVLQGDYPVGVYMSGKTIKADEIAYFYDQPSATDIQPDQRTTLDSSNHDCIGRFRPWYYDFVFKVVNVDPEYSGMYFDVTITLRKQGILDQQQWAEHFLREDHDLIQLNGPLPDGSTIFKYNRVLHHNGKVYGSANIDDFFKEVICPEWPALPPM